MITSPLRRGDVGCVTGVPVTSAARTAFDLARRGPFVEAVVAVDALLHVAPYCLDDLHRLVNDRSWHGTFGRPAVLAAADEGSESPMETVYNRPEHMIAEVRQALALCRNDR